MNTNIQEEKSESIIIIISKSEVECNTVEIECCIREKSIVDLIMNDYCKLISDEYIKIKNLEKNNDSTI